MSLELREGGGGGVLLYYYCTITDFDGSPSFLGESLVCMMELLAYLAKKLMMMMRTHAGFDAYCVLNMCTDREKIERRSTGKEQIPTLL